MALWLYVRNKHRREEVHAVFVVAAVLCAITLLSAWIMRTSFFSSGGALAAAGIPTLFSLIATIAIAKRSFDVDRGEIDAE